MKQGDSGRQKELERGRHRPETWEGSTKSVSKRTKQENQLTIKKNR
jgi:hypothetical protein